MELIELVKALVSKNPKAWDLVSVDDKEKNFFIINRYMSKKYPDKSQLFNIKTIDKVSAMNLWHYFIIKEPYPNWFWSKGNKGDKSEISNKDFKLLKGKLKIKEFDLEYLVKNHRDFVEEELKYYKSLEKQLK